MKWRELVILLLIVVLYPTSSHGSGSIYISDIQALLNTRPELWRCIASSFDIEDVGTAPRINVRVNPILVGTRVAPYSFDAKPKGSRGHFVFTIEIRAKTHYYDSRNKEVNIESAVRLKEEMESIIIRPRAKSEIQAESALLPNSDRK